MAELVAERIRAQVVGGSLREGEFLPPEHELMEVFGVSRPTLREALRILESEQLLGVRRGAKGGAFVTMPDPEVVTRQAGVLLRLTGATLSDVYEARSIIEPAAVRMGAQRLDADAIAELRQLVDDLATRTEDLASFPEAAAAFHQRLVELCGNRTLSLMARMVGDLSKVTYEHMLRNGDVPIVDPTRRRKAVRSYRRLLELMEARKADEAEALWRRHMAAAVRGMPDVYRTEEIST